MAAINITLNDLTAEQSMLQLRDRLNPNAALLVAPCLSVYAENTRAVPRSTRLLQGVGARGAEAVPTRVVPSQAVTIRADDGTLAPLDEVSRATGTGTDGSQVSYSTRDIGQGYGMVRTNKKGPRLHAGLDLFPAPPSALGYSSASAYVPRGAASHCAPLFAPCAGTLTNRVQWNADTKEVTGGGFYASIAPANDRSIRDIWLMHMGLNDRRVMERKSTEAEWPERPDFYTGSAFTLFNKGWRSVGTIPGRFQTDTVAIDPRTGGATSGVTFTHVLTHEAMLAIYEYKRRLFGASAASAAMARFGIRLTYGAAGPAYVNEWVVEYTRPETYIVHPASNAEIDEMNDATFAWYSRHIVRKSGLDPAVYAKSVSMSWIVDNLKRGATGLLVTELMGAAFTARLLSFPGFVLALAAGSENVANAGTLNRVDQSWVSGVFSIASGSTVRPGQFIGLCGNSGLTGGGSGIGAGAHVHYQINGKDGTPINPDIIPHIQ